MEILPVVEFVRDAEATGFCTNRINRHRHRSWRIGPSWAVEKCSGVQHRRDPLLGRTDQAGHRPVEESVDHSLAGRGHPCQSERHLAGCRPGSDYVAVGRERRPAVDDDMARARRPGRAGRHHDIATSTDGDGMDPVGERHLGAPPGEAIQAEFVDHG